MELFRKCFAGHSTIVRAAEEQCSDYKQSPDPNFPSKSLFDDTAKILAPAPQGIMLDRRQFIKNGYLKPGAAFLAGGVLTATVDYAVANAIDYLRDNRLDPIDSGFIADLNESRSSQVILESLLQMYPSGDPRRYLTKIVARFDRGALLEVGDEQFLNSLLIPTDR